jgi:very-short-patch-repair endonuclease
MTQPGASFPPLQGEGVRAADGWGSAASPRLLRPGIAGPCGRVLARQRFSLPYKGRVSAQRTGGVQQHFVAPSGPAGPDHLPLAGEEKRRPCFPAFSREHVRAADRLGFDGVAVRPGNKSAVKAARRLRDSMTETEVILWSRLRMLRAYGLHFRRQAPRDGYILDFLCLKARLIIEVDGEQHHLGNRLARDELRDSHFGAAGFLTLRFSNREIRKNLDAVMDQIIDAASGRLLQGARP